MKSKTGSEREICVWRIAILMLLPSLTFLSFPFSSFFLCVRVCVCSGNSFGASGGRTLQQHVQVSVCVCVCLCVCFGSEYKFVYDVFSVFLSAIYAHIVSKKASNKSTS